MILFVTCFTILLEMCTSKPDSSFPLRLGVAAADQVKDGQDHSADDRVTRALPSFIGTVIKGLRLNKQGENFAVYKKAGGFQEALADFKSMKPQKPVVFKGTYWGRLEDGRTVLLRREKDEAIMEIWEYKTFPDGRSQRIKTDKVEYSD